MSDTALVPRTDESLKASLLVAYGLYLLALVTGGLGAVVGVIVVYVRRADARGTLWQSHCRNLLWVFWIGVAVSVLLLGIVVQGAGSLAWSLFHTEGNPPPELVGGLLALVPVLYLGAVIFVIWYLYRTVRGLVRALDSQPY
jgi:uncharacterized membrane protein